MSPAVFFAVLFSLAFSPLHAQVISSDLAPRATEKGMRFAFRPLPDRSPASVSLAGNFTGWTLQPMVLDSATGIWERYVKLKAGETYYYKFVLDGSFWVTDPNAPDYTKDDNRNGILIGEEFGKPYVRNLYPPRNYLMKRLQPLSVLLCSDSGIEEKSISVTLNRNPIPFRLKKDTVFLTLPATLKDDEYFLSVSFRNRHGVVSSPFETSFILDRTVTAITTPSFYRDAVMYEIFVRQFHDSDGDGVGDLNGVTAKLPYLESLGVSVIWLMPINPSPYGHGYSITDYYDIEPSIGTKADFKRLLDEAHRRGMRVIMDYVINHTDSTHTYFQDAFRNPGSNYAQWYQFTEPDHSNWNHFGGSRFMPKLNFFHPPMEEWAIAVAKYWLNFGVDGFRCDAAKEPPHKFWKRLRQELKAIRPDVLLLGEVWDNANYIIPFFRDEFDMVYDYPMFYPLIDLIANGNRDRFVRGIEEVRQSFPENALLTRFISNHDNTRALSVFNGDTAKLFQALTVIWTLDGMPMIYYGDEIGLLGKLPPDDAVRQPMPWSRVDSTNRIFSFTKTLTALRARTPGFRAEHSSSHPTVLFLETSSPSVLAYIRTTDRRATRSKGSPPSYHLVILNLSDTALSDVTLRFPAGPLSAAFSLETQLTTRPVEPEPKWRGEVYRPFAELEPRAIRVIHLTSPNREKR